MNQVNLKTVWQVLSCLHYVTSWGVCCWRGTVQYHWCCSVFMCSLVTETREDTEPVVKRLVLGSPAEINRAGLQVTQCFVVLVCLSCIWSRVVICMSIIISLCSLLLTSEFKTCLVNSWLQCLWGNLNPFSIGLHSCFTAFVGSL